MHVKTRLSQSILSKIVRSKSQRKVYLQIELKSTTFVKLTCVISNCNNFRTRIFNQIQIPASETSRARGFAAHRSLFKIDLWASLLIINFPNIYMRGKLLYVI
jgi:hypothetical protein